MTSAQVSYYLFLSSCFIGIVVPTVVLIVFMVEAQRRWGLRFAKVSYRTPETGVHVFGIEVLQRKVRGIPAPILFVGMVAALILLSFFLPGTYHILQMSPEQYVQKLSEAAQSTKSK